MHLQRADAGRQVNDAGQSSRSAPVLQLLHQRMDPKTQRQIQA